MALTGEHLTADQAQSGAYLECVDDDALGGGWPWPRNWPPSPPGLAAIKSIIRTTSSRTLDEELDLQRDEMRRLGFSRDYREGVTAFLEKRPATFEGR